jgi:hypothetical protein
VQSHTYCEEEASVVGSALVGSVALMLFTTLLMGGWICAGLAVTAGITFAFPALLLPANQTLCAFAVLCVWVLCADVRAGICAAWVEVGWGLCVHTLMTNGGGAISGFVGENVISS